MGAPQMTTLTDSERVQRLFDLAARGRISRRGLLELASVLGIGALVAGPAVVQALAAGENQNSAPLRSEYDYVIVGAGSAGCVVARRLVDATTARILLVEAGSSDVGIESMINPTLWTENIGSDHDYKYLYAPTPRIDGRTILLSRGKVLGGSSSTNGLIWARPHRADFDAWEASGADGWGYESVLPYFKKIEDWEGGASELRGAGGPMRIETAKNLHPVASALIEAGRSAGMPVLHDLNGPSGFGVGPLNMNVRGGARDSSSRAYLRPVMDKPQLKVITNARVIKLRFIGTRCVGVDLLVEGKLHNIVAKAEVVLSGGTIDTPRLLLQSGVGKAADLKALGIEPTFDLPGVGRNLQDHVILAATAFDAAIPMEPYNNNMEGAALFWGSRAGLDAPDLAFLPIQKAFLTPELEETNPLPATAFSIAPGLLATKSRGYFRLLSKEPDGPLEIQPNMLAEQADLDVLVAGFELALDLASRPAYRKITKRWIVPAKRLSRRELIALIRMGASSYYHPVGTCAIGKGADSVVDSKLRVHGIEGLRIADASVMPNIIRAHTNATSVMIGEVAGALLASKPQDGVASTAAARAVL
jgi:choline dehydrogenase